LSVEAAQLRFICDDDTVFAERPEGTEGGALSALTETVTFAETVPELLVAVRTYVVVALGDVVTDVPITAPTPLLIDKLGVGVPDTVHDSLVNCPGLIVVGDAVKEEIAGACPIVVADALNDWAETLPAAS